MTDRPSTTQDERWWASGLTPRPGGNPPEIPADYLYDPKSNVYWDPLRPGFIPPRTTPPVIDRRVLPNGEVEEWERARSIPDDFIYDPEADAYFAPGNEPGAPKTNDIEALTQRIRDTIAEIRSRPRIPQDQVPKIPPGLLDKSKRRRQTKPRERDTRQRTLFGEDDDAPAVEQEQP